MLSIDSQLADRLDAGFPEGMSQFRRCVRELAMSFGIGAGLAR